MGSYHTNCRNISVQLTHRFIDSKTYARNKWPSEFITDFLPLLEQFRYQQGSLMQNTPETNSKDGVSPLAPVHECIWLPEEIQVLTHVIRDINCLDDSAKVHVCMVTKRAKAVICNGFLISCTTSRYSKSNLIFAKPPTSNFALGEVVYYSECHFEFACNDSPSEKSSLWFIAVMWHMDHPCRVWYGYPTEVWSCTQCSQLDFIPFENFRSRVVYTKTSIDFGRVFGCGPAIVATPIELNLVN